MALRAGAAFVDVMPRLGPGFSSSIQRQINDPIARSADESGRRWGDTFKRLAVMAGGLFAAKVGVDFFKGAISGASDLAETVSKSNTIFREGAPAIEKWANGAATGIGQSKKQALDAAATFGNLFSQLGIGTEQTAKMSTKMVELASDFASFHNADVSDVISAQTAAFRGEYDAVQRFVPTINAAAVEQKALEMGLAKTSKELDAQDKALATQTLLLEGAGAATGDFARTSDGLANKQRILAAKMDDFKAKLGSALMPAMSAVVGFISDRLLPGIESAGRGISAALTPVIAGVKAFFYTLKTGFTEDEGTPIEMVALFIRDKLLPVVQQIVDFVRAHFVPVIGAAAIALGLLISPVGLVIAALVAAYVRFEGFRNVVNAVVEFIATKVIPGIAALAAVVIEKLGEAVEWVRSVWPQISEAIGHVMNVVAGIVRTVIDVVSALWRAWGDDLMRLVGAVWDHIGSTIKNALDFVKSIIQVVLAVINGDWSKAWDGIKGALSAVWEQIKAVIELGIATVKAVIGGVLSTIAEIWRGAWDGIKSTVSGAIDSVVGFVTSIPGRIRSAVSGAFDGLKDAFRAAVNWIIDKWNGLRVPGITIGGWDPPGPGPKFPSFTTPEVNLPNLPRLAAGGLFSGLALVGEEGPELVASGGLARVHSSPDLAGMLAAALGDADFGRGAPVVAIENAVFSDEVDVDLLFGKAQFAAMAGRFG